MLDKTLVYELLILGQSLIFIMIFNFNMRLRTRDFLFKSPKSGPLLRLLIKIYSQTIDLIVWLLAHYWESFGKFVLILPRLLTASKSARSRLFILLQFQLLFLVLLNCLHNVDFDLIQRNGVPLLVISWRFSRRHVRDRLLSEALFAQTPHT